MVHRGELTETDGSVMPVAIKTIKCELLGVTIQHIYISYSYKLKFCKGLGSRNSNHEEF